MPHRTDHVIHQFRVAVQEFAVSHPYTWTAAKYLAAFILGALVF